MTLTRTDPEPCERSLVARGGIRWVRLEDQWHAQSADGTPREALTWAELTGDSWVELLIVGLHGLPPQGVHRNDRRNTMRGDHP